MTRQTTKYPEIAKTAGTVMAAETPFTAANKTLIDALRRICGDAHVLTHQDPSADPVSYTHLTLPTICSV